MKRKQELLGLHHVTAITADPQRNLDFYSQMLGLRFVKLTVNFDDPGSYHFYYGDEVGHPGTILTFFAWPGAPRGRQGVGQIASLAFSIPPSALGYWISRFLERGMNHLVPVERFDQRVLSLRDPDGLAVELVTAPEVEELPGWKDGPVPPEHTIRGIAGITLWEGASEQTVHFLTDTLGFEFVAQQGNLSRYTLGTAPRRNWIEVRCAPDFWPGMVAAGSIHHVAWRAASDEAQLSWQEYLVKNRVNVTPVLDRKYFHSIYFPEPGGVLFEIATDPPGFTVDEPVESLGNRLQLPSWLESDRATIESMLPPLQDSRKYEFTQTMGQKMTERWD